VNRVSGAYRHSDLFERRIVLMRDWCQHVVSAMRGEAPEVKTLTRRR